mmetsp:Transcript_4924/g.5686  ORF Transcript_4924/g.5686 Transcript_4924/m.5686 type:complete len:125 (+) Transcript_4924:1098-1472(+)
MRTFNWNTSIILWHIVRIFSIISCIDPARSQGRRKNYYALLSIDLKGANYGGHFFACEVFHFLLPLLVVVTFLIYDFAYYLQFYSHLLSPERLLSREGQALQSNSSLLERPQVECKTRNCFGIF